MGEFLVHKTYFALAVVFLAAVVAAPIVILSTQPGYGFDGNIIIQNPSGMDTGGNLTFPFDEQLQEQRTNTVIILVAVEAVFVLLFVVTLYYGLKTHPTPK